jgi:ABC-type transport system involved in multi-copper enzyme maturation permease subunit
LVWKEVNPRRVPRGADPKRPRFSIRHALEVVPVAAIFGWLLSFKPIAESPAGNLPLLVGFAVLLLFGFLWCVSTASRAMESVCRERERRTLDGLLTLPVSRSAILGAKWFGSIVHPPFWYFVAVPLALNAGLNAAQPLRPLLLTAAVAAQVAFLASLGIRVSVASRTTLRAIVVIAVLLFVFVAGGWVALGIDRGASNAVNFVGSASDSRKGMSTADAGHVRGLFYTIGLNPLGGCIFLSGLRDAENDTALDRQFRDTQYAVSAYGTLIYALAAGVLWLDAWRCFRAGSGG